MSVQEFDRIYFTSQKGSAHGKMRLAPPGIGWKSPTGEIVTVKAEDLKKLMWLRSARNYQLRVQLRDGSMMKFDNFSREAYDELRESARSNYHLPVEHVELSLKGWNWGSTELLGSDLVFRAGGRTLFELPYSEIANVYSGKNEVTLECGTSDGSSAAVGPGQDQLVECRFHVPGMAPNENDDGIDVEGDADKDGDSGVQTAADFLCSAIKSKAELGVERGDTIVSFKELPFLTPRGRYDVDMFPDFLRLRGKSYDYKISYSSITKLFMLPKADDLHVIFVVGLDPPLRQGQTRYHFLVLQFVRDDEMTTELNLDETMIADKYEGKLQRNYDAPTFEVVSAIFRGLTGKKITIPGSFRSATGAFGFKCSLKANEGYLYALEKSLLFIPKPPTLMAHTDISYVTFSRVSGGSSRTIDMVFTMRSGVDIPLSNISREEYAGLDEYLKDKRIKVKNELVEETRLPYLDDDDDDDEDDGSGRRKKRRSDADLDDEDDESPDEDFIAGSDSDPEEEYDSDYNGESDAEDGAEREPKRKASSTSSRKKGEGKKSSSSTKAKAPDAGSSKVKSDEFVDDSDDDE